MDDAMEHADGIDLSPPAPGDPANLYQGGPFVLAETGGDPHKQT